MLPDIVIIVSSTHWQCVTCKLHTERSESLDLHLSQSHPFLPLSSSYAHCALSAVAQQAVPSKKENLNTLCSGESQQRRSSRTRKCQKKSLAWSTGPDFDADNDSLGCPETDDDKDKDFVPNNFKTKHPKLKSVRNNRRSNQRSLLKTDFTDKRESADKFLEPARNISKKSVQIAELEVQHDVTKPVIYHNVETDASNTNTCDGKTGASNKKDNINDLSIEMSEPSLCMLPNKKPPVSTKAKYLQGNAHLLAASRPRGRPSKPKSNHAEVDEIIPRRPYRKRVLDPSELLLKLRSVGRKPNARKTMPADKRSALTSKMMKFISRGLSKACLPSNEDTTSDRESAAVSDGCSKISWDSHSGSEAEVSMSLAVASEKQQLQKVRCKICSYPFSSDKQFQDHLTKVGSEDVVQCLVCAMKFHGQCDLNLHIFCDHEIDYQPVCMQCEAEFSSMEQLERHLFTSHKGEKARMMKDTRFHDCQLCNMEMNVDLQLIKNHYYRRHKAYVCPDCFGKESELMFYTDTDLYAEHKQKHAESSSECSICSSQFSSKREMNAHMWTHASDTTDDGTGGNCIMCDKWLPNAGALLMHEKKHRNEAVRKNYALEASIGFPCMRCEHIFCSKSNLKKHVCKADLERAFYFHCEYCAHGCNTKEQLRDHIALRHFGIKRYKCSNCNEQFVCAPTLRRHIRRVHTKEKPYKCHICQERFFERNLMLRHVSKHTGLASFVCERCGKGFHTNFDLKKHAENHTASREYVCPHCGLNYKRIGHLKRHVQRGCRKRKKGDILNSPSVESTSLASLSPCKSTPADRVLTVVKEEQRTQTDEEDSDEMVFMVESNSLENPSPCNSTSADHILTVKEEQRTKTDKEDADEMVFKDLAVDDGCDGDNDFSEEDDSLDINGENSQSEQDDDVHGDTVCD